MNEENLDREGVVYHAGFPNASEGMESIALSLDKLIVRHKASTYFWKLDDSGIPELGWDRGDIVVVDRALIPKHLDYIVAVVNEEFVLRQFVRTDDRQYLAKPNGEQEKQDAAAWGVVTYVVHQMKRQS